MVVPTRHYGLIRTTPDARDYAFKAPRRYTGAFVDLSEGFAQVYNQLALGSCVSNGTAGAVDFAAKKQGLAPFGPSRLFVYFQGRRRGGWPINQDTGLQIRDGLNAVALDGAPPETDWPYNIARFAEEPPAKAYEDGLARQATKYAQVDPHDIDAAIVSGYPVVQGFNVFESFESDEVARTGIVPMPGPRESIIGGHCTNIVSTPKDGSEIGGVPGIAYRLHLNSWGEDWGLGGRYWAPVAFTASHASDFWVITHMEDPAVTPPEPPAGDVDEVFAAVLRSWVNRPHWTLNGNRRVARAATRWLTQKGLWP